MRYTRLRNLYNVHIFGWQLTRVLRGCDKVLELGCGRNSLLVRAGITRKLNVTGVDIYEPYIENHKLMGNYTRCFCADIAEVEFGDHEFDAVVCMDVIEHISKRDVIDSGLLSNMQHWGKKVIITTPNGYADNDPIDGNRYNRHISEWSVGELESYGYKVRGLSGWKKLRTKGCRLRYTFPYLFWAALSLMSGIVTYFIPKWSWLITTVGKDE